MVRDMYMHCSRARSDALMCRAAIEKLRTDNAALKEELVLENKFSVAPSQASAAALIQNLQQSSDIYTAKASVHCCTNVAAHVRARKEAELLSQSRLLHARPSCALRSCETRSSI